MFDGDEDRRRGSQACRKLGTHSVRKLSATEARRKGAPKDDLDHRARWSKKRQQYDYVDMELTWPDVNVAYRLCFDGPCRYLINKDAPLSDEWLCHNVTPRITDTFSPKVGAILARPLLWACFHSTVGERVEPSIRRWVVSSLIRLSRDRDARDDNPVERVRVVASEGTEELLYGVDRFDVTMLTRNLSSLSMHQ